MVLLPSLTPIPGVALLALLLPVVDVPTPVLVEPPGAVLAELDDPVAAPDPPEAPDDAEPEEPPAPPAPPPPPPPPPWANAAIVENVTAQAVAITSFLVIMILSLVARNNELVVNAFQFGKPASSLRCNKLRKMSSSLARWHSNEIVLFLDLGFDPDSLSNNGRSKAQHSRSAPPINAQAELDEGESYRSGYRPFKFRKRFRLPPNNFAPYHLA